MRFALPHIFPSVFLSGVERTQPTVFELILIFTALTTSRSRLSLSPARLSRASEQFQSSIKFPRLRVSSARCNQWDQTLLHHTTIQFIHSIRSWLRHLKNNLYNDHFMYPCTCECSRSVTTSNQFCWKRGYPRIYIQYTYTVWVNVQPMPFGDGGLMVLKSSMMIFTSSTGGLSWSSYRYTFIRRMLLLSFLPSHVHKYVYNIYVCMYTTMKRIPQLPKSQFRFMYMYIIMYVYHFHQWWGNGGRIKIEKEFVGGTRDWDTHTAGG